MKQLPLKMAWLAVFVAVVLMIGMHAYFRNVIIPAQQADAAVRDIPRGNLSDLYPRWLGARELLLHHRDPYSDEVTTDIQRGFFGRPLDPNRPNDPKDESRFAYPAYIVFLLAPTVTLNFKTVQLLYFAFAALLSAASVWLWMRTLGYRSFFPQMLVAALLFVGSYPVAQALYLQQPALIVAALVAVAFAAISSGRYRTAGLMMGLAMIKPQTAAPITAWLLFWSLFGWKDRKHLVISFVVTMAVLCGAAELFLSGWIWKWRTAASAYMKYAPGGPANVRFLLGSTLGAAAGIALVLAVGVFCWKARSDSPSSDRFKLAPALILVVQMAVTPIWHPYDLMFLLPAVLLIFHWKVRFQLLKPLAGAIVGLSALVFLWQWVGALLLAIVALKSPEIAGHWQFLPVLPVFFAPTLVLISLTLIARVQLAEPGGLHDEMD